MTPQACLCSCELGNSVTVARLTLDQLVLVRIQVPQIVNPCGLDGCEGFFMRKQSLALKYINAAGQLFGYSGKERVLTRGQTLYDKKVDKLARMS